MASIPEKADAGLRGQDHYKSKLPWYRYTPRQWLLPLVRFETPYVASLQSALRTSSLDSYFSITANLGTHTFFMLFLPILAWCGQPNLCRAMVHILAAGVCFTGAAKDFLCLPRPLSPPLVRITMSHGAALEYGFPSTHSCNALSVAVYALVALNDPETKIDPTLKSGLELWAATYAVSIVLGRLYCGMHGFLDVMVGSLMGGAISLIQYAYVSTFDSWFLNGGLLSLVLVFAIAILAVRVHPEPADDCPCFDDSVAFAGVVLGIEGSNWFHAQRLGPISPLERANEFHFESLGWTGSFLRIAVGIATIIAWRYIAKIVLLNGLPPLFRLVGRAGFLLPRRFFQQAPDYDKVPASIEMDTLIPSISKLPSFVRSIAHPRKNRSVSVGPQSAADAYEAIAYRQKVRRESQDRLAVPAIGPRARNGQQIHEAAHRDLRMSAKPATSTGLQKPNMPPTPPASSTNLTSEPFGSEALAASAASQPSNTTAAAARPSPLTPSDSAQELSLLRERSRTPSADRREREEDRAVFASLPKPRTRFDIEIATKLVVYSGIGFIATGFMCMVFPRIGLA